MEDEIEKILNSLLSLDRKNITNTNYTNGEFSFSYGGGKFILIRSVSPSLTTGYLNLFHKTPFDGDKQLREVIDFEIKIIKNAWETEYKIKNHMGFNPDDYKRFVGDDGYMRIEFDDLLHIFPNQLIAKLVKDDFKIYLI